MSVHYISLLYSLTFLIISFILIREMKKITSSPLKNIFWSFTAFIITKTTFIISDLSLNFLVLDNIFLSNNIHPFIVIINTLSVVFSIISNVFLFHFGISILTYKTSIRIDYKIFPMFLFIIYISLFLSGIIEFYSAERISRYSFGFNGAFLGSLGCFNLYNINKKHHGEKKMLSWYITCSIALFFYAGTEGIIIKPVMGISVEILRLLSSITLLISAFFIVELPKEERRDRIGFI